MRGGFGLPFLLRRFPLNLPEPINGTEAYLKAINDNLIAIRGKLERPPETLEGVVELREPANPGKKGRVK